jgi:hypothetical protein
MQSHSSLRTQPAPNKNSNPFLNPLEKKLAIYFHNHIKHANTLWEKLGVFIPKHFSTRWLRGGAVV